MNSKKSPAHGSSRGEAIQQNTPSHHNPRGAFRRESLPDPIAYYDSEGIRLSGRGAWRDAVCPFHEDSRPSLRVNIDTGAFRCMACGAHGGDVLSFHRRRHVMGFVDAAKALGAWGAA